MDKSEIRKYISDLKAKMVRSDIERRSIDIAEQLFATAEYKNAKVIFAYMSYNQEVDTDPIIKRALADGKQVAVPRTYPGRKMEFIYINDKTAYEVKKGIKEPTEGEIADTDALVIVPGLAFGRDMNRIGYGGGFYDRYFAAHSERSFLKAGICFDFQIFDRLEAEEHDEKIDMLISG